MPKPISTNFCRRVVDAYLAGEGAYKKLASQFSPSWNSVRRWVYFEKTFRAAERDRADVLAKESKQYKRSFYG